MNQIKEAARKMLAADEQAYLLVEPYQDTATIKVLSAVGAVGDQGPLRLVAAATALGGFLSRDARLLRGAVRMIAAHELATILKNVVKRRVVRSRPKHAKDRDDRKIRKGKRTEKAVTSFPSGHSAGSIAVARAFTREFPEYRTQALATAVTIAAAQVPRCSHYVTDVAAGLAVGAVAEAFVDAIWNGLSQRSS